MFLWPTSWNAHHRWHNAMPNLAIPAGGMIHRHGEDDGNPPLGQLHGLPSEEVFESWAKNKTKCSGCILLLVSCTCGGQTNVRGAGAIRWPSTGVLLHRCLLGQTPSLSFFLGFHLHRSSLSNGGSKGSLTLLQAPVNDSHKVYKEVIWPLYQILGCCGPCCEVKV